MDKVEEKIRIQRAIKNYSQEYMAWCLGISQSAYSNLEKGETNISLQRVYDIAEILEISPFELMPPPRSGAGINGDFFQRTIYKLRKFWTRNIQKRKSKVPEEVNVFQSDI